MVGARTGEFGYVSKVQVEVRRLRLGLRFRFGRVEYGLTSLQPDWVAGLRDGHHVPDGVLRVFYDKPRHDVLQQRPYVRVRVTEPRHEL